MREIKFRVWDKEEKCMHQVDSIDFPLGKPSGKDIVVYNEKEDYHEWIYEYELMQCVGIKDKNGVEIYEGDILEYTFNGETNRDVIVYDGTAFTYKSAFRWSLHQDKIIGNIYENPELLENE